MKQYQIANIFNVYPSEISRMLSKSHLKRRTPTLSFSVKLKSYLGGEVEEWMKSDVETLTAAFELIFEFEKKRAAA